MVTIAHDVPARRPRTSVTLAGLLAERDASLATNTSNIALAVLRAKRALVTARAGVEWSARACVSMVLALAVFLSRHALVLGGLAAFTVAAWTFSPIAGMVMLGLSAFFLELRRP